MSSQSPTTLSQNDHCKLREITAQLQMEYPRLKITEAYALDQALVQTGAPSWKEAIGIVYHAYVHDRKINRAACAAR